MSRPEEMDQQDGTTVESIETIVRQMLDMLKDYKDQLSELIVQRLLVEPPSGVNNPLEEFRDWLEQGNFDDMNLKWLGPFLGGSTDRDILKEAAWDCLQVVVLAYLPGPQYFQGAYIHSELRTPERLERIKLSFRVPHLNGAVGWMSARQLDAKVKPKPPYELLYDAQLDLRGRVAVSDLHLGNRSVLGFPVSINTQNCELASISGFVFFSHPVPGVFPAPDHELAQVFKDIRAQYESGLASAIESYIFRRYGKYVLTEREALTKSERTPLLTLSDDDPTGFLVTVLFESEPAGTLSAECEINEDVLLETTSWHLRVANIYPEKWGPRFVQHMRRLADLIEGPNIHLRVPVVWFSRKDADNPAFSQKWYPSEWRADSSVLAESLNATLQSGGDRPRSELAGVENSLNDIMRLFGSLSGPNRQADLVIPIYGEDEGSIASLGFFRLNCEAPATQTDVEVDSAFHNLWRSLKSLHGELNPEIARLLLEFEKEHKPTDVQHVKLWLDTSHLLSEWLARQIHQVVWRLTNLAPFPKQREEVDYETLLGFALETLSSPGDDGLMLAFKACLEKCKALLAAPIDGIIEPLPEIAFVSCWPRMKVPVIRNIAQVKPEVKSSAESEFANLMAADPGLLRILTIFASMPGVDEEISLVPPQAEVSDGQWAHVNFGFSTSRDMAHLKVKRFHQNGLVMDIEWQQGSETGSTTRQVRLRWDHGERATQPRNLGSHAISVVPQTVARWLGAHLLAGLDLRLAPDTQREMLAQNFNPRAYHRILKYVVSPDGRKMEDQFENLERAMLYGTSEAAGWRMLLVKSSPPAFLAALCDRNVKRPAVLAFRDFALANAKAFHVAREYDAQREAADEYARNLSAIAHGYKGPIRQLGFAVDDARKIISGSKDRLEAEEQLDQLQKMVRSARQLASDAITYAWRKARSIRMDDTDGKELRDQINEVIRALDRPRFPQVEFDGDALDQTVVVKSASSLWRHLLSKLIDNALTEVKEYPEQKVFLRAEVEPERLVLRITNYISTESLSSTNETLSERCERVRVGLTEGRAKPREEGSNSGEKSGYGLIEAYNCCAILGIKADVEADEEASRLLITLAMVRSD
jgi:signal transduction histidine kinase